MEDSSVLPPARLYFIQVSRKNNSKTNIAINVPDGDLLFSYGGGSLFYIILDDNIVSDLFISDLYCVVLW